MGGNAFDGCPFSCVYAYGDSPVLRQVAKESCCHGSIVNGNSCGSTCSIGYYYKSNECKQCSYLRSAISFSPYECDQLYIGLPLGGVIAIELFLVLIFISSFTFIRDRDGSIDYKPAVGLFLYCVLPALDVFTDLAYILQTLFYNELLFVLVLLFFVSSWFHFLKLLWNRGIKAKFWICPIPECLFFSEYDNIFKLAVTGVASIPFVIINLPVLLPVLLLGVALFRYIVTIILLLLSVTQPLS